MVSFLSPTATTIVAKWYAQWVPFFGCVPLNFLGFWVAVVHYVVPVYG
ncbi:MAG: hypothetical protein ACP5IZ_09070 [Thermoprotei archaeon]